jgi:DNA polymerase-1
MKNKYFELISSIQPDTRSQLDSILIIDGLNTFLRSFTMINHVNSDGHHIGGLTGFLKSIGYAIKILNPTKVIIVFDGVGGSNAKKTVYAGYKANRNVNRMTNYSIFSSKDEENESIANQISRLMQYLHLLPVTVIGIDGLEADDIIGYLTLRFESFPETKEVRIMSADKDFLQLVSNKTSIYSPMKKKIYKPKDVLDEYGVSSYNFINYKVLLGDQSDNVPGVSGLGPKKLLKFFPELQHDTRVTLDSIVEKSTEKIKENKVFLSIVESYQQLQINEQIMSLDGNCISEENKKVIKEMFTNSFTLDKYMFHQLYVNDKLGESIPNVENWLQMTFGYLNSFN